jgi:hypothetical protein
MKLEGSCHCGAVRFTVESPEPYPYNRCYCTICRKTQGGGGYAVNLGARSESLTVEGRDAVTVYQAQNSDFEDGLSPLRRHFCGKCGSGLWCYDPRWPDLVHPFASAIDTPLPTPPEYVHLMVRYKAPWCETEGKDNDPRFDEYPSESLAEWHEKRGLTC